MWDEFEYRLDALRATKVTSNYTKFETSRIFFLFGEDLTLLFCLAEFLWLVKLQHDYIDEQYRVASNHAEQSQGSYICDTKILCELIGSVKNIWFTMAN